MSLSTSDPADLGTGGGGFGPTSIRETGDTFEPFFGAFGGPGTASSSQAFGRFFTGSMSILKFTASPTLKPPK